MKAHKPEVNNEIYHHYGERWYQAKEDPVALLRAEARLKNPWVAGVLMQNLNSNARVLDVGCGAGFLSNHLAKQGYVVHGIDAAADCLEVARRHDTSGKVQYMEADAYRLPFSDHFFDAVTCMDFLEHVEHPEKVVAECARVLRPGGLFFFHTFSRNLLSYLIVIKGVKWVLRNAPEDIHIYRLFLNPPELDQMCLRHELHREHINGIRPKVNRAFFRMLRKGQVDDDFEFIFQSSLKTGYLGYSKKVPASLPV